MNAVFKARKNSYKELPMSDAEESSTPNAGSLAGRAALVTGAGVGIGRAIAESLAAAGAFVGIHYRESADDARATLDVIVEAGGDGMLIQGDLTFPEQCANVVDRLVAAKSRLDILVNNAGSPIERAKLEDCSIELWQQILATNLTSAFLVTQHATPHLRASGHGAIVNNLSLSVQTGGANGAGAYAIAKGGLQVMTRTLARELAPDVRTNSIMPGVIETRHHDIFTKPERLQEYRDETPLKRNGTAQEVGEVVRFLVSDEARFVNGATIDINGGRFLR
ncbi:MAG: 3-oxoacyl-[acyl-carrier protein] reductase [Porticoccaceae bacterium]|jgi:3-oxoacyl-[acyl-carrier protein] reductase